MASVKSLTIGGKTIFDLVYPVGSIYETDNEGFDPNTSFGGTWERIKGKVIVGVDKEDGDFDTVCKTGGEKNHTLTIAEMPSHGHTTAFSYLCSAIATNGGGAGWTHFTADATNNLTSNTGGGKSQQHASVLCCIHLEKNSLRNFSSDIRKEENKLWQA